MLANVLSLYSLKVSSKGSFTLNIGVDMIITLSTLTGQQKGSFSNIPSSKQFPSPYKDDFDGGCMVAFPMFWFIVFYLQSILYLVNQTTLLIKLGYLK